MSKILIVDDEADVVQVVKRFLEGRGYMVFTASDGDSALEQIKKNRPDIVLLDILMPRKNGLDVLQEVKQLDPDIPVIMLTAVPDEGRKAVEHGAANYILKPADLHYLEEVVWWKLQLKAPCDQN